MDDFDDYNDFDTDFDVDLDCDADDVESCADRAIEYGYDDENDRYFS